MFQKRQWNDRNVEHPSRRKLSQVSGESNVYDVVRAEGTITEPGDAFNAANMNDLENRIFKACNLATYKTLNAGQTSITLENENINNNSVLSFYTSIYGVQPNSVSVSNGSVTLNFDAQKSAMQVGVKVDGVMN